MEDNNMTGKIVKTFLKKLHRRIRKEALYVAQNYPQYPTLINDYYRLLGIYFDRLYHLDEWVKEVDNIARLQEFLKIYDKEYKLLNKAGKDEFLYSNLSDWYEGFIADLEKFLINFSKKY